MMFTKPQNDTDCSSRSVQFSSVQFHSFPFPLIGSLFGLCSCEFELCLHICLYLPDICVSLFYAIVTLCVGVCVYACAEKCNLILLPTGKYSKRHHTQSSLSLTSGDLQRPTCLSRSVFVENIAILSHLLNCQGSCDICGLWLLRFSSLVLFELWLPAPTCSFASAITIAVFLVVVLCSFLRAKYD